MSEKYNIEELIIRFLQQDINEEELHYLESWLEEDAEHKSYFFGLKSISDSSRRSFFSKEEVNEASWQRMLARIEKDNIEISSYDKSHTYNLWLSLIKYVAIVAIAVGVGWGIKEFQGNTYLSNSKEKEVVYNEIHVQKGGHANTLVLSDGTKVILNAATTFKYPTSFGEKNRMVYLEGEAYFEVAKCVDRPFIVNANGMRIRVLGTSFNVRAYEGEERQTTLVEGCVEVAYGEQRVKINPGQQVALNNGHLEVRQVDIHIYSGWKSGRFVFEDHPLAEVLRELERWYDVQIVVEDERVEQLKFTSDFPRYEDIDKVLDIIELATCVKFEVRGRTITVRMAE